MISNAEIINLSMRVIYLSPCLPKKKIMQLAFYYLLHVEQTSGSSKKSKHMKLEQAAFIDD